MISCGAQATVPIVHAVSSVVPVPYAEIVASVASRSAGPGTRANIDEFTHTTSRAIETVGGAQRGKAIIVLNPVEPPMIMRDTVFCAIPAAPTPTRSPRRSPPGRRGAAVRARLHAARRAAVRRGAGFLAGQRPGRGLPRGARGRGLPARVRGQPGHHDLGRRPGRRGHRPAARGEGAGMGTRRARPCSSHHRHDPARRQPRHGAPVHRGAGPRHRARPGRGRRRGHRGHPRRRPGRVLVQLRLLPGGRDRSDRGRRRGATQAKIAVLLVPGIGTKDDLRNSRRPGPRWPGSRPTAPRRTCPSSTSGWPASWASRPSAS